jgi:sugar lactone lactonase YvrE
MAGGAAPAQEAHMKRLNRGSVLVILISIFAVPVVEAWDRMPATQFAALPAGATLPEGITADADGNIYVTTFGTPTPGALIVYDHSGRLLRQVSVQNASSALLGLAFHPQTGDLLVLDFGQGKVLKVQPFTGASSVFINVGPPPAHGLNGLTFDAAGNVYVSDSFAGTIWKTGSTGGSFSAWSTSPLLQPTGVPPFGANGIAFNNAGTTMFVANTANDTIVQIPVTTPNSPSVFVNSINGPDGLMIDDHDNIWVVANQADEIVVVDPTGRVIAKHGDFGGIDAKAAPVGLLFPASLVFSRGFVYVTNLSLDLKAALGNAFATVDSPWAAEVKTYTVARIPFRIPPVRGLD